jgi:hypothetical protein
VLLKVGIKKYGFRYETASVAKVSQETRLRVDKRGD